MGAGECLRHSQLLLPSDFHNNSMVLDFSLPISQELFQRAASAVHTSLHQERPSRPLSTFASPRNRQRRQRRVKPYFVSEAHQRPHGHDRRSVIIRSK
jgi:hypothetical protein